MNKTVGTCGNCGGRVTVPDAWYAVIPPTPTCVRCGAAAKMTHGPVLPMEGPRRAVPGKDELWCAKTGPVSGLTAEVSGRTRSA